MENRYWRRCCVLTIMDRVGTETIKEKMKVEVSLTDKIEEKQLSCYGHMRRMEEQRLPNHIWNWIPNRRRRKDRPRTRWKHGIDVAMNRRNMEENSWLNKREWRANCDNGLECCKKSRSNNNK